MTLLTLFSAIIMTASAVPPHVSDAKVSRFDDIIDISYNIESTEKLKSTSRIIVTPVLKSENGADSLEFSPVTIAGRRAYYTLIRRDSKKHQVYESSSSLEIPIEHKVAYQSWMEKSELRFSYREEGCCDSPVMYEEFPVASLDFTPRSFSPSYLYVTPGRDAASAGVKRRELKGSAYIDFPVNRTEIFPDYRRNPSELAMINATIDSINSDNDIEIRSITIKGYASPEGEYSNNLRLAKGRTQSLIKYVRQLHKFSPEVLHTDWEAEDWAGLENWILKSNLEKKDEILKIVCDTTISPDMRDNRIRRDFPEQYDMLLASVYPSLRRSDYSIDYTITQFSDPKRILELVLTAPQKLSLDELYLAGATLVPGTPEYSLLWETAATMYPDSKAALVNAANSYMASGALDKADRLLVNAGDYPEAVYARANLAAMQGNTEFARTLFLEAERLNIGNASEALTRLDQQERPVMIILNN